MYIYLFCLLFFIGNTFADDKYEVFSKQIEYLNNNLSTTYSAINLELAIASAILTLLAIGLGIYVTILTKKVKKAKKDTNNVYNSVYKLKQDIENYISLKSKELYNLIRRDDTKSMLDLISINPKNISYVANNLTIRKLDPADFAIIKRAFLLIHEDNQTSDRESNKIYTHILLKNFPRSCIIDTELRANIFNCSQHQIFSSILDNAQLEYVVINCFKAFYDIGFQNAKEEELKKFIFSMIVPGLLNTPNSQPIFNQIGLIFESGESFQWLMDFVDKITNSAGDIDLNARNALIAKLTQGYANRLETK